MFIPASSLSTVLYGMESRRRTACLVGVHGMEDPTDSGLELADQYENATRIGLDRVGADYALTIPFRFAFYGDLWQAHEAGLRWGDPIRKLDRFGPFMQLYPLDTVGDPSHAEIEVGLALELLASARIPIRGIRADYVLTNPTLATLLAEMERNMPGVAAKGVLWNFATTVASYLTEPDLREMLLSRLAVEIEGKHEEVVLLAHGLGSITCYELLMRYPDLPVRCLVTLGSPLGLEIVRVALAEVLDLDDEMDEGMLLFPSRLPRWINLYNSADSVASPNLLSPLYKPQSRYDSRRVEDIDTGKPRPPSVTNLFAGHHPATYLSSKVGGMVIRSVVEK